MSTSMFPFLKPALLAGLIATLAVLLAGCGSGGAIAATSWPGLSTNGTKAYIAFNQAIVAIDLTTGNPLWQFPEEPDSGRTFYAPPTPTEGGLILVGGFDNLIYALETVDDRQVRVVWTFEEAGDRFIGGAVVAEDTVLIPSADHNLYALDLATGNPIWSSPFVADQSLWSAPLVQGGTAYIASLDHRIYAIDLSSGDEIWSSDDLNGAIVDTPTMADDLLLAGTFGSQLLALNARMGGEIEWTFDTQGWVWGNPAVVNGMAYFGDTDGVAYAVDISDGNEAWRQSLDGAITASPALKDGIVYFVTEAGTVYAFETESGRSFWASNPNLNGKLLSDPLVVDDVLLVPAIESECLLSAVEAGSGAVRCLFQPSD